jgi:hypothetical protein
LAKPIPRRKSKTRIDEAVARQLEIFELATKARYRMATAAFDAQDEKTKEAIRMIRDRLSVLATGTIRIFPDGRKNPGVTVTISQELVDSNLLYMATEIVKDLAFMDIRVEGYEFPKVYCAECGDKLNKVRKKRG